MSAAHSSPYRQHQVGSALSARASFLYESPVINEGFGARACVLQDHVGDRANKRTPCPDAHKLLLAHTQASIQFATLR